MAKNILEVPFWKLAIRFSIIFLLVISFILTLLTFMKNENLHAIPQSIEDGSWFTYVLNRVLLAIIYGVSMAYFTRRKERQNLRPRK